MVSPWKWEPILQVLHVCLFLRNAQIAHSSYGGWSWVFVLVGQRRIQKISWVLGNARALQSSRIWPEHLVSNSSGQADVLLHPETSWGPATFTSRSISCVRSIYWKRKVLILQIHVRYPTYSSVWTQPPPSNEWTRITCQAEISFLV